MYPAISDQRFLGEVLTIGHSTYRIDTFIDLLFRHQVTAVCDVRSTPFSRVNPQYNRDDLEKSLKARGVTYVFLGRELGARSQDPTCYVGGRVQYERLAQTELFRAGLNRVQEGMKKYRIALMCAERDPLQCHRTILVAKHLDAAGIQVHHISNEGTLESQADILRRLVRQLGLPEHDLFRTPEDLFAEAYRIQAERIAFVQTGVNSDTSKPLEGIAR